MKPLHEDSSVTVVLPVKIFLLLLGSTLMLLSVLLLQPSSAQGQPLTMNRGPKITGPYLGIAAGPTDYSQDYTFTDEFGFQVEEHRDFQLDSLELRGGLDINRWLALEVRMGSGGDDHNVLGGDTVVSVDLNFYQNAFLKVKFPSYIQPYALFGVSNIHANFCRDGEGCRDESEIEESVGMGIFFPVRGDYTTGLFAEHIEYISHNDYRDAGDLDGGRFGIKIGF